MLVNLPGDAPFYIKHVRDKHPVQADFLPMHAHSHYEILIFISGDITYLVEGNAYTPKPWDILIFNIAETHKVLLNSDAPYERLVIQMQKELFSKIIPSETLFFPFFNGGLGENNLLHPSDFKDELWKQCVCRLQESPKDDLTALPLLLPLLHEIRYAYLHKENAEEDATQASQIVLYVNEHISEELSPDLLAQKFLISRTALYTLFHRATGTGIHDYINVKRLIAAQELLKQGNRPTKVYEQVGFKDYTTFFRAYKKLFGTPPRQDVGK